MAGKTLKNNKKRSFVMFLAVALASFMVFSVLTVGITYFQMQQIQNMRLSGARFDAIMYGATLFLLPEVVQTLGIKHVQVSISFHPLIFLATVLFILLTVSSAYWRPAKMAVSISPIEAVRYRPGHGSRRTHKC